MSAPARRENKNGRTGAQKWAYCSAKMPIRRHESDTFANALFFNPNRSLDRKGNFFVIVFLLFVRFLPFVGIFSASLSVV